MIHFLSINRLRIIWAIAKKDLKIAFRFPKNFIASRLIEPIRLFIVFGLVYQSFFSLTASETFGSWSKENYIPTLLLGGIFYSSFAYAYSRFRLSFLSEKYWQTIQIFLTAPVSKADFLVGSALAVAIELSIPTSCYLALFQFIYPVSPVSLFLILMTLYLMLLGTLGFSLMQGAFAISNQNYLFIFDYIYAGWSLFSCFYYTSAAIPEALRFLTTINPVYHAMEIARAMVFHHLSCVQILISMAYVLFFAMVVPFLGAAFFRKVVRELGVRGF
ncbi:MAG: ABC transporter permease [Candidatus Omnitrophica bacterium]|nr:ABC transporter permease [Candidatus Omnitrophota bacterium]